MKQVFSYLRRYIAWLLSGGGLPLSLVLLCATAYTLSFPLVRYYAVPYASFARITNQHWAAATGLACAAAGVLLLSLQMYRLAEQKPSPALRLVWLGWAGASLALLLAFPGQTSDLADYAYRAHMLAHLHLNPLVTPPSAVTSRELYPFLGWYNVTDPYGPLWHALAVTVHRLAGESLLYNMLGFKLLAIGSTGLSGMFIYFTLKRLAPGLASAGLAAWLWNPLVLLEGALNGHNDLAMTAVLLAGVYFLLCERGGWGLFALVAAGLVKASAWVWLPPALLWLWRERGLRRALRIALPALLAGAALVWFAYKPLGGLQRLVDLAQKRSWWPTGTWAAALFFTWRDVWGGAHAVVQRWVTGVSNLLFAAVAGLLLIRVRELRLSLWSVSLAYLLIATVWFQPWYAVGAVGLAALLARGPALSYTRLLTFFFVLHPILSQFWISRPGLAPGLYDLNMALSVLLFPQAAALWLAWRAISLKKSLAHAASANPPRQE